MAKAVAKKAVKKVEKEETTIFDTGVETKENLDAVTIQEFDAMIREYSEQRDEYQQLDHERGKAREVMDNTGARLIALMDNFKKTSYKSCYGTLIRSERWSWKTPKSDDERKAFFTYLKEKEVYDSMRTINSNTLNSFCKKELESAKEANDLDFSIPGLQDPTCSVKIALRK